MLSAFLPLPGFAPVQSGGPRFRDTDAQSLRSDTQSRRHQRRRCVALPGDVSANLGSLPSFFDLVLAAETIITSPSIVCLLHVSGSEDQKMFTATMRDQSAAMAQYPQI
ncbi:hypothetical protein T10_3649 [Trichinella papuae]|uniref:Uncharacterized protein n=1 Tax=Trichinella papuae TaxID=268474 RepID=A0A0V1M2T5_9BILA|nr:hypothetical protein T10_3649 [Trichinella papuae]